MVLYDPGCFSIFCIGNCLSIRCNPGTQASNQIKCLDFWQESTCLSRIIRVGNTIASTISGGVKPRKRCTATKQPIFAGFAIAETHIWIHLVLSHYREGLEEIFGRGS